MREDPDGYQPVAPRRRNRLDFLDEEQALAETAHGVPDPAERGGPPGAHGKAAEVGAHGMDVPGPAATPAREHVDRAAERNGPAGPEHARVSRAEADEPAVARPAGRVRADLWVRGPFVFGDPVTSDEFYRIFPVTATLSGFAKGHTNEQNRKADATLQLITLTPPAPRTMEGFGPYL